MGSTVETEYTFAHFAFDPRRGVLRQDDHEIELRPKCHILLRYLIENAGRLVSKDELLRAIWPNVVATDESLTRCVCDLRLALRDRGQTIVKTVRGRGFLFTGPPRVRPAEPAGADGGTAPQPRRAPAFTDLALPLIGQILATTALRGRAYEGFYQSTRPYAAMPGEYIHDQVLVKMGADGVLRFKMATGGVLVDGWLLPVHTQLYAIGTEFGSGGLVFAILHGVSSVKAEALDGIILSSTFDVGRTPAASTIMVRRVADLTDDPEADDARLIALGSGNPVADKDSLPADLRRHLARPVGVDAPGYGLDGVLRLPIAQSHAHSAPFASE